MRTGFKIIFLSLVAISSNAIAENVATMDAEYTGWLKKATTPRIVAETPVQTAALTAACSANTVAFAVPAIINTFPILAAVMALMDPNESLEKVGPGPALAGGALTFVFESVSNGVKYVWDGKPSNWNWTAQSYIPSNDLRKYLYSESTACRKSIRHLYYIGSELQSR